MEISIILIFICLVAWTRHKVKVKIDNAKDSDGISDEKPSLSIMIDHYDLSKQIEEYLNAYQIKFWNSENKMSFKTGFDCEKEGLFDMFVNIHENHLTFACEVLKDICDNDVPKIAEIVNRINQLYNFGHLTFYYEERVVIFKIVYPLFQNILTEKKFRMYFESSLDGARNCRPVLNKVVNEGEEPIIAMLNI